MIISNRLRKLAGFLIEFGPDKTEAQGKPTAKRSGRKPMPIKTAEQTSPSAEGLDDLPSLLMEDGKVDFSAIYHQANLPAVPFTAEQMLEILLSLPPELALDTKRQTVKATLNAVGRSLGATEEGVCTDASCKLAAITAYSEKMSAQTSEYLANIQMEIAALEATIGEKRSTIESIRLKLMQFTQMCQVESRQLEDLLKFLEHGKEESKQ